MPQPPKASASPAPYAPRPNAPRWDVRLARSVLTSHAGLADIDGDVAAPDGFSAGAEHSDVLVWWTQDYSLAAPRRPEARHRWIRTLDRIEAALDEAGFTIVRRTHKSVLVRAPVPAEPQTTARVRPAGPPQEFKDAVTFDGYDPETASGFIILFSNYGPKSWLYAVDAQGTQIGIGYRGLPHAVHALAEHYGLPAPLDIVHEREDGR